MSDGNECQHCGKTALFCRCYDLGGFNPPKSVTTPSGPPVEEPCPTWADSAASILCPECKGRGRRRVDRPVLAGTPEQGKQAGGESTSHPGSEDRETDSAASPAPLRAEGKPSRQEIERLVDDHEVACEYGRAHPYAKKTRQALLDAIDRKEGKA